MKLKKSEIIIIAIVFVIALAVFIGYRYWVSNNHGSTTDDPKVDNTINFTHPETGEDALPEMIVQQDNPDIQVIYGQSVVMLLNSSIDGYYELTGDYGVMHIEVKDGSWRVTDEECPNHICSSTGWVNHDSYFPIICIPNNVAVILLDA